MNDKKTIFSGMQPTGMPQIGNYIGAIQNWVRLSDEYNCLFCVVDMHAITVRQDPETLRKQARSLAALYIAMGLDPDVNVLYIQSHVRQHAELAWILNCYTYVGELSRMTQFKEKSAKHEDNINAGLFTYPVLMAADILLFGSDVVPVGEDQKQHLELARDIAARFNNVYGDTFTVPEPYIGKEGARIMGLQNPESKMSKSGDNPADAVSLLDEPNVIVSKIKRAVTDSEAVVRYDPAGKPGVSNLLTIYAQMSGKTVAEAERDFAGKGYGDFKAGVAEAVVNKLTPIQREYERIITDRGFLDAALRKNAERASLLAEKTLRKVKKKVGFVTF